MPQKSHWEPLEHVFFRRIPTFRVMRKPFYATGMFGAL